MPHQHHSPSNRPGAWSELDDSDNSATVGHKNGLHNHATAILREKRVQNDNLMAVLADTEVHLDLDAPLLLTRKDLLVI